MKMESISVLPEFIDIRQLNLQDTHYASDPGSVLKDAVSSKINNVCKPQEHFLKSHFLSHLPLTFFSSSYPRLECFSRLSSLILSSLWENRRRKGCCVGGYGWSVQPGPGATQEGFPEELAFGLNPEG